VGMADIRMFARKTRATADKLPGGLWEKTTHCCRFWTRSAVNKGQLCLQGERLLLGWIEQSAAQLIRL